RRGHHHDHHTILLQNLLRCPREIQPFFFLCVCVCVIVADGGPPPPQKTTEAPQHRWTDRDRWTKTTPRTVRLQASNRAPPVCVFRACLYLADNKGRRKYR
ncbi:unnamed protein product, partial [Ectocarpus sp. 6 AP-2014]